MSYNPNPLYAAPEDWRAYSGVLSRRVFAFILDYVIVALLCIPAAIVLFFLSIVTLGLGFFLYPALFVIVAKHLLRPDCGRAEPGLARHARHGNRDRARRWTTDGFHDGDRASGPVLDPQLGADAAHSACLSLFIERSRLVHDLLVGTATVRTA